MPYKPRVTVYINPASSQQLRDVAGYTLADGSPAIDVVCLFAGNYAASEPPYLRANNDPSTTNPFNKNIQTVLDDGSVGYLLEQGLTVLLTVTNGLHPVGWSEFTSEDDATAFAQYLQTDIVEAYGLSGIDIDDEYSHGSPNDTSLIMVTTIMRSLMPEIVISKALWSDGPYFAATWNGNTLAENLSYGAEMSYGGAPQYRLPPYTTSGLPAANCLAPSQVSCGFWANQPSSDPGEDVQWLQEHGYAGFMVFGFDDQANVDLTGTLVNAWYGPGNWNPPS